MNRPKFTIFTPCYNGEKTIRRVFESVAKQTFTDFEWIIINDGSKDKSGEVIESLIQENPVLKDKITYLCQENKGKHRSWNIAIKMAKGELFVPADCDDSFLPETLDFFNKVWNHYGASDISGINVCCYNPLDGKIIGSQYPQDGLYSNNIELKYKYRIKGEHWGCVRVDLLKERLFPEVDGHYFSESYLWFGLALSYKVVCFNKPLRAYYFESSSLSNNKHYRFDKVTAKNRLRFQIWELKNAGSTIFRISPKSYVLLYYYLFRSFVIFIISCFQSCR